MIPVSAQKFMTRPDEYFETLDPRQAYEWVRTGVWNRGVFLKWVTLTQAHQFCKGMDHQQKLNPLPQAVT